jgi:transposase
LIKRRKRNNNTDDFKIKKKKTIEELRAERENEEKIKTQRLLNGPSTSSNVSSIQLDDRKRRYNSQFNPDLARY